MKKSQEVSKQQIEQIEAKIQRDYPNRAKILLESCSHPQTQEAAMHIFGELSLPNMNLLIALGQKYIKDFKQFAGDLDVFKSLRDLLLKARQAQYIKKESKEALQEKKTLGQGQKETYAHQYKERTQEKMTRKQLNQQLERLINQIKKSNSPEVKPLKLQKRLEDQVTRVLSYTTTLRSLLQTRLQNNERVINQEWIKHDNPNQENQRRTELERLRVGQGQLNNRINTMPINQPLQNRPIDEIKITHEDITNIKKDLTDLVTITKAIKEQKKKQDLKLTTLATSVQKANTTLGSLDTQIKRIRDDQKQIKQSCGLPWFRALVQLLIIIVSVLALTGINASIKNNSIHYKKPASDMLSGLSQQCANAVILQDSQNKQNKFGIPFKNVAVGTLEQQQTALFVSQQSLVYPSYSLSCQEKVTSETDPLLVERKQLHDE